MDPGTQILLQLIVGVVCGIICSCIASSKGRSPIGWFFVGFLIGLIGLIIICCLSNAKEDQARRTAVEQENHRLREQIRQEQIKSEAFRTHAQRRLDMHDETLGIDTRADGNLLEASAPVARLLQGDNQPPAADIAQEVAGWYYSMAGQNYGPVTRSKMAQMLQVGAIPRNVLVWIEGMADWKPAANVPELNELVRS